MRSVLPLDLLKIALIISKLSVMTYLISHSIAGECGMEPNVLATCLPNFADLNRWGFPPDCHKNAGKSLDDAGLYPLTWV